MINIFSGIIRFQVAVQLEVLVFLQLELQLLQLVIKVPVVDMTGEEEESLGVLLTNVVSFLRNYELIELIDLSEVEKLLV